MARRRSTRLASLAAANLLLPFALLVFAVGFFPFKPLLPGLATFSDVGEGESDLWSGDEGVSGNGQPEAMFTRVVFMVVDALRSDFVYGKGSGFEFVQSLIRSGAALPFTAHATPPTVTMPRVKALTTGSVPSFADLIFNLDESGSGGRGSSLASQDTWLAQIRARGGKLVFYGDDTWLRLFPAEAEGEGGFFEREEGTSSFFVSDFTEVDTNVTRHVPAELARGDWDAMILHYLGLDHIGHKTGPCGPNMLPKQKEMDGVVRTIYEAMEGEPHQKDTLLVLLGDHGMNAGGNHGGSGPGETEPAMVFASPKLLHRRKGPFSRVYEAPTVPDEGTEFRFYRKIQQSDVVPTLAALMGFPVSKNSLGVFIREFVGMWPGEGKAETRLLVQNARQVKRILGAAFGGEGGFDARGEVYAERASGLKDDDTLRCEEVEGGVQEELACLWAVARRRAILALTTETEGAVEAGQRSLLRFLETAQEVLSGVASSYDIPKMLAGTGITTVALGLSLLSFQRLWPPNPASMYFGLTGLLYGIMMFASSYVEEEQHFWYWLTPAWILLLTGLSASRSTTEKKWKAAAAGALILAVHRVAIRWNQTGQKHAGEPDIVHAFFPKHHVLMWVLVLGAYGFSAYALARRTFLDLVSLEIAVAAAVTLVLPALVFKLNFTQADAPELVGGLGSAIRGATASFSLVSQAQLVFGLLGLATATVVTISVGLTRSTVLAKSNGPAVRMTLAERLHYLLALFLMTQTRAPNIPLFLGLQLQLEALSLLLDSPKSRSVGSRRNARSSVMELATSVLLLSHTYFFCMGGSNSISSVDLSNAYNGVADYSVLAVGVLLFASNWTGPIWWCSAAVVLTFTRPAAAPIPDRNMNRGRSWIEEERVKLREDARAAVHTSSSAEHTGVEDDEVDAWLTYVSSVTAFIAVSLLAVMTACTALRTHLFIWTVFSPKYLYAAAWAVGWHVLVNIGSGGLLRWLGQIA